MREKRETRARERRRVKLKVTALAVEIRLTRFRTLGDVTLIV